MRGARQVVFPAGRGADAELWLYRLILVVGAASWLSHAHGDPSIWHGAGPATIVLLAVPILTFQIAIARRELGMGVVGLLLAGVAAVLIPPLFLWSNTADQYACSARLKQVTLVALQYADGFDGRVPAVEVDWTVAYQIYLKNDEMFHCPEDDHTVSYTLNPFLRGKKLSDLPIQPSDVMLAYDSDGVGPVARHDGYCTVAFADGHVKTYPLDRIWGVRNPWEPDAEDRP